MTQRASPRGHPTAPSGDCAAGTFAPALARALSLALLVLFAYAAFRDTSADSATGRRAPVYLTSPGSVGGRRAGLRTFAEPWFCHGSPCAPFAADAARSGAGYEARAYEPATYLSVNITAINAEVALAEGVLLLERYARGANAGNASVPRGAPTLVVMRPTGPDYAGLTPAFTVAAYLPPLEGGGARGGGGGGKKGGPVLPDPAPFPAPTDPGVVLTPRPPAHTFVLPFGGFARGGPALANAARVALALTRAGVPFRAGAAFGLALYDPPTRWAGRHNEVWVWGSSGEWEGAGGRLGGGDGRAGGAVATHL